MNALIFIQAENNKISRSSIETICGIQKLFSSSEDTISTISFNEAITEELNTYKINNNYFINDMTDFHPLKYTAALEKIINDKKPNIIACAHTYQARDWIPRLSARLNIPFVSDCIDVKKDGENIIITRQMYQGKINADIAILNPRLKLPPSWLSLSSNPAANPD